jgi:D-arabinose 5-phosphate isomerase GutQ
MGTSFELPAALYLLSMVECLVSSFRTRSTLQKTIGSYFEKLLDSLEGEAFKACCSEDKITQAVSLINEVKNRQKVKIQKAVDVLEKIEREESYSKREVTEAIAVLKEARDSHPAKVYISGDGISHKIALMFMTRLRHLDVSVEVAGARHVQTELRKDDVAIIIGAYTKEDRFRNVLDTALEVGAKTVIIAGKTDPALEAKVNVAFFVNGTKRIPQGLDFAQLMVRGMKPFKPSTMLFWAKALILTDVFISQLGKVEGHVQWTVEFPASMPFTPYSRSRLPDKTQYKTIIDGFGGSDVLSE